ncbi:exodeoxyribonuclease VII large subunit [Puteibacter caeruleilacunae]|nr:exodeoxyribonuclease VII large subunit [Puteibacter caeruleilacunae]
MNHIKLSQLNQRIVHTLEQEFSQPVWIIAEIAELKENRNGHCYLELVEKDEATNRITARARATIWAYTYRMLKPHFETVTGQRFSSGIKVLISVQVNFHEVFGFSLNIRDIDPAYTLGDLAQKRKEIIARLERDGIIGMNKELELETVPNRIAVISSPTAAGYEDFCDQLDGNAFGFYFKHQLFPAIMQGDQAEESIIEAIEQIYAVEHEFDVVVIIRGGGSQLDLNCFDSYDLACNITQFPLPVITGIGHEKDDTVADVVAHTKVKTPTAAAEFLINRVGMYANVVEQLADRFVAGVNEVLTTEKHRLEMASQKLSPMVNGLLERQNAKIGLLNAEFKSITMQRLKQNHEKLSIMATNIESLSKHYILNELTELKTHHKHLKMLTENFVKSEQKRLDSLEKTKTLLDPVNVLKRGFSMSYVDGQLLKKTDQVKSGDQMITVLADGKIRSTVD